MVELRDPRLRAYQRLLRSIRERQARPAGGSAWTQFLERLPLMLGETATDRLAPYALSDAVIAVLEGGIDSLVDLLRRRNDPAYDKEKRAALLADEQARVALWPRRFSPRTLPASSPLRGVIRHALLCSADLDGGLLESWFGRAAGGAALFDTLLAILRRALLLSHDQASRSGIGLMTHLALQNSTLRAKERLKQASPRGLAYARLDRAVGVALQAVFLQVVEAATVTLIAQPGTPEEADHAILWASLDPQVFLSQRSPDPAESLTPQGFSPRAEAILAPLYQAGLEHGNDPQALLQECLRAIPTLGDLATPLLREAACAGLRGIALDHLLVNEDPAAAADQALSQAFPDNAALLALLETPKLTRDLAADLRRRLALGIEAPRPESQHLLGHLERVAQAGPPWLAPGAADQAFLQALVERFLTGRFDAFAQGHLEQARRRVADRRESTTTQQRILDYEAGRIYRIGIDELPLVKTRTESRQGQLFVDLKGYTRRTARAKELVIADFLKKEFYEPILSAAKRYAGGSGLLPSEQNLRLVNLLGDAVVFSGNVVSLIRLARDIQATFLRYQRELERLTSAEDRSNYSAKQRQVERRRLSIQDEIKAHQAELESVKLEVFRRCSLPPAELGKEFPQILAPLAPLPAEERARRLGDLLCAPLLKQVRDLEARMRMLEEEDRTLQDGLEQERHLRLGHGLEAGLFISYGAPAEIIELDDDEWGRRQVAISERLNEAARGTARNPAVLQHLEAQVAAERLAQANLRLELPFRVYVANTRAFALEPAANRLWARAAEERDPELIARFVEAVTRQIRHQLEEPRPAEGAGSPLITTDIYNIGEAVSFPALDAYLQETRNTHFFFRIQIRPAELHPDFRARFFFAEEMVHLILGRPLQPAAAPAEIFRYAGQVLFRGFEFNQPTQVFEMLSADSPFVRLLAQHHLADWLAEAALNPDCRLETLAVRPPRDLPGA